MFEPYLNPAFYYRECFYMLLIAMSVLVAIGLALWWALTFLDQRLPFLSAAKVFLVGHLPLTPLVAAWSFAHSCEMTHNPNFGLGSRWAWMDWPGWDLLASDYWLWFFGFLLIFIWANGQRQIRAHAQSMNPA